jgi:hypothetical protein
MDPIDDIGAKVTSARAALQKEKTDIYNRLHSIQEDAQFVSRVSATYPRYPIVGELKTSIKRTPNLNRVVRSLFSQSTLRSMVLRPVSRKHSDMPFGPDLAADFISARPAKSTRTLNPRTDILDSGISISAAQTSISFP